MKKWKNRRIVQNGFDLFRKTGSTPNKQAKMSSIIINSFYRALTSIDEFEGIKNLTVKQLTRLLVDQLYPEDGVLVWENEDTLKIRRTPAVQEVTVPVVTAEPVVAPAEPEVKEIQVKEVKPKLTKEEKAAAKVAKEAAKAVKDAAKAAKDAAKASKVPKVKEPEPAPAPVEPAPAPAPAPEAPKVKEPKESKAKTPKEPKEPKAKFVGNLEKLTPTQDKLLKKTATEGNVELASDAKTKFIAFVNAMDNKDFNAKKLEEHMKAFFAPKAVVEKDADLVEVEYKGNMYWVDVNSKDVYETEIHADGSEIDKKVGKVGLLNFAGMKMPVE